MNIYVYVNLKLIYFVLFLKMVKYLVLMFMYKKKKNRLILSCTYYNL